VYIIKDAKIVENKELKEVTILIEAGKIKQIISGNNILTPAEKEIDAKGNIVFPGFIDPHVHFDDPGFTDGKNFDYKLNIVKSKAYVDFAFWGGVTPEQVESGEYKESLKELKDRGIVGVKFYTISGMELYPRMPISDMDKAFRLMKELNLVCAVHAEDYHLVDYYSRLMQDMGREDPESWSEGRTYEAEPEAIWSLVGITEKVGNKLHIVHLSTKEGLNVIRWAKARGLNVSTDFKKLGSVLKIAPPLRKEEDRKELWKGLKDGSIDFICTDHAAGKYPEEKSSPDIWKNYAGIPGTQLVVPTMLHYGYHQGRLTLSEIQKLMSGNTAKRYGLYPQKGIIKVGGDADFTIVDLDKKWVVEPSKLESKGKYSPLIGKELTGQIYMTIVRGEVIYRADKGIIGAKGYGKLLKTKIK